MLVIDDDPLVSVVVRRAMEGVSHRLFTAPDAATGLAEIKARSPDLVILDHVLPDGLGLDVLRRVHDFAPELPILFITARGSGASAIEAMKLSAFDYLPKPLDPPKLREQIDRILSHRRILHAERDSLLGESMRASELPAEPASLVGDCPAMQTVFKSIGKVAGQDVAVLIRGEHGTGKEAVAKEIHAHSPRSAGPLVSFTCRGLDDRRLNEELFGTADSPECRLAEAKGGTLVLLGVSALSLPLQAKLLKVVREGGYEPAGGGPTRRVECRLIAITTDDLESKSRAGEFRSDLYYALSSFVITLPPIRQRHGDLGLLVQNSLAKIKPIAQAFGIDNPRVSDEAMRALSAHLWPGNLNELDSVLKRALIEQKGNILLPTQLFDSDAAESVVATAEGPRSDRYASDWAAFTDMRVEAGTDTLHAEAIAETERKLFSRLLRHTRGNQAQAARYLGITRASLRKKLRLYGMVAKPPEE